MLYSNNIHFTQKCPAFYDMITLLTEHLLCAMQSWKCCIWTHLYVVVVPYVIKTFPSNSGDN